MFEKQIAKYVEEHNFERLTPKVMLFDMDGTLYDSMPNHAVAWQQAMQQCGLMMTENDVYATEGMRGIDTIRNMVIHQQNRTISEAEAQSMYDIKAKLFHEMPTAPVFEGAFQLFKLLKQQNIAIAVVTGSAQHQLFQRLIDDFQGYIQPQHIVTAYDVDRGKPAPEPYLKGLQITGNHQPNHAIVVENAPMGVRSGVAAGIFTVAINSGPLPDSMLLEQGANLIFPSLTDFLGAWPTLYQEAMRI